VIQESVNNVVKHAAASRLDISILSDSTGDVMIEDNGKGTMQEALKKRQWFGITKHVSRIQYLQGTVDWASSPDNGTVVSIHVLPKRRTKNAQKTPTTFLSFSISG
jgi:signal transduction histidine kinase